MLRLIVHIQAKPWLKYRDLCCLNVNFFPPCHLCDISKSAVVYFARPPHFQSNLWTVWICNHIVWQKDAINLWQCWSTRGKWLDNHNIGIKQPHSDLWPFIELDSEIFFWCISSCGFLLKKCSSFYVVSEMWPSWTEITARFVSHYLHEKVFISICDHLIWNILLN